MDFTSWVSLTTSKWDTCRIFKSIARVIFDWQQEVHLCGAGEEEVGVKVHELLDAGEGIEDFAGAEYL